MLSIFSYSILAFVSGFSPNLAFLLVVRSLFGIAMGGEWGVGASLTMETIPARSRGFVSGVLQCGYPTGYLLASVAYGVLYQHIGWRGMIMLGALPALLVFYIQRSVPESPGWTPKEDMVGNTVSVVKHHWRLAIYAILLMTAFNFFSHGTQDLYPTFLRVQHKFNPQVLSAIAVTYNIGAIAGGLYFGSLSQRIGRRRAIVIASLLAIPIIPFWAYAGTPILLAIAAFAMQFMVQGAWGVIPAHLNELSPAEARGTFPGFTYQLGNFLASSNLIIQGNIAAANHGNYSAALAIVAGVVALAIALLVGFGIEKKDIDMSADSGTARDSPMPLLTPQEAK
jgi:SHS family lactate transporter-like MFS transporter